MILHIDVIQEDIDHGTKYSRTACMVHRAIVRCSEGTLAWLEVAPNGLYDTRDEGPYNRSPFLWFEESVRNKLIEWDAGLYTKPFSFDVELPENILTGEQP